MPKRYPQAILVSCELPWDEHQRLMEDTFRAQVRKTLESFNHLYIFGTAGEGYAVTLSQFREVAQVFWEETDRPDVPESDNFHHYDWSESIKGPCDCGCEIEEVRIDGGKGGSSTTMEVFYKCGLVLGFEIIENGAVHSYTDTPGDCVLDREKHRGVHQA